MDIEHRFSLSLNCCIWLDNVFRYAESYIGAKYEQSPFFKYILVNSSFLFIIS